MKVLILGGYGVFGGHCARLLIEDGHEVFVAGRSLPKAQAFAARHGGTALHCDVDDKDQLRQCFADADPDVVVDAVGPFQAYDGYGTAEAALEAGAHVLDLSDDARFTHGIAQLNDTARATGLSVLSGVSSVPALSSAAVGTLAEGLDIAIIESAILPGNRAPRGHSVMAAILAQAGAPVAVWRGGRWREVPGWSGSKPFDLTPGLKRRGAFIGAPDLALFPEAFGARSVLFRAGLELGIMHRGLAVVAWLRRCTGLPDLTRFTSLFRRAATLLEPFGSDRGGMVVRVGGRDQTGAPFERQWTLVVDGGRGPFVPGLPVAILVDKLSKGGAAPGARPALSEFTLDEAETALARLAATCSRTNTPAPRLFEAALGERWPALPPKIRAMHDIWDTQSATGRARITKGNTLLSRLIGTLFRFPEAGEDVPVTVTMERRGDTETWTRDFAGKRFRSHLSAAGAGHVFERFGPFRFRIELTKTAGGFGMEVRGGSVFGLPIPRRFLPRSDTEERMENERFVFDVRLSLPFAGLLVHYQGWLEPDYVTPQS